MWCYCLNMKCPLEAQGLSSWLLVRRAVLGALETLGGQPYSEEIHQ